MQIDLLGDYALVRYDCVVHISMAEGMDKITDNQAALDQLVNKAKYLDVLKRQDAGEWKVYRHMWNDAPQDIGET
jgi:ketosteroid isomerase-like protein